MIKIASLVFNPFTHDSRVLKEALSLNNADYDVCIVAHGDKDLKNEEEVQGIRVKRLSYLDRKRTKSKFIKLFKYFSYLVSSVFFTKKFDVLHCHDLNALPIAVLVRTFYNKDVKVVYDAHEYETQTNGLSKRMQKLLFKIERFCLRYVDEVITVGNMIADEYVRLYDIKKPSLVLNTPPFKEVQKSNIFRESLGISEEQAIFLYQGALGRGRGIEEVLNYFKKSSSEDVIVFMGYGTLEDEIQEAAKQYANIYLHKAVNPEVVLEYTSSADFAIATIQDTCLSYRYCLPNKVFEYLMVGLPIIVSELPEMKQLVQKYKVGVVLDSNTENPFQSAILDVKNIDTNQLKQSMKEVTSLYNWQEQEKVLLEVYKTMLAYEKR